MKKIIFLIAILPLLHANLFGQQINNRLNFILLVDNDVVRSNVNAGYFLINNSTGKSIDTVRFEYQVGALIIKKHDYSRLHSIDSNSQVFICFNYWNYMFDHDKIFTYKCKITPEWLNEDYIILKIYNYANKYSRKKYEIKKNSYRFIIEVPGHENVIPERE
jgi:hypothetical protein